MTRPVVVLGMSGGVDSAVAASLLLEKGWDVVGATIRMQPCKQRPGDEDDCIDDATSAARQTAAQLGIPHHVLDAADLFRQEVLAPAWNEYERGRTPNPCVRCNELVKFATLLSLADELGVEKVATGHHARIAPGPDGRPRLLRGADPGKDQSYFLFRLLPVLDRLIFPIGALTKKEVRSKAEESGLSVANRPDSQDACIVNAGTGRTEFSEALRKLFHGQAKPGIIADVSGRVLGRHSGYHQFTIGQRRGLGVASAEGRLYVVSLDPARALVTVGPRDALMSHGLEARQVRWAGRPKDGIFPVQIRYRHRAVPATVSIGDRPDSLVIRFASPQPSVTPGQAVVLYQDDAVVAGGWIDRAIPEALQKRQAPLSARDENGGLDH